MNGFLEDSVLPIASTILAFYQIQFKAAVRILFLSSLLSSLIDEDRSILNAINFVISISVPFMSNCNFKMCWQILYCSVCLADTPNDPADFFPLSVHYQERLSAAGRTRY